MCCLWAEWVMWAALYPHFTVFPRVPGNGRQAGRLASWWSGPSLYCGIGKALWLLS